MSIIELEDDGEWVQNPCPVCEQELDIVNSRTPGILIQRCLTGHYAGTRWADHVRRA